VRLAVPPRSGLQFDEGALGKTSGAEAVKAPMNASTTAFIVMRPQPKYSMDALSYCTAHIVVIDAEKIDQ
jgi:hypothetical protein